MTVLLAYLLSSMLLLAEVKSVTCGKETHAFSTGPLIHLHLSKGGCDDLPESVELSQVLLVTSICFLSLVYQTLTTRSKRTFLAK